MAKYRFDLIVSTVCCILLGYFIWHALEGPRSFSHRDQLVERAVKLEGDLAGLKTVSASLDARVQLMRPESIDPDMLDELARRTLEYVEPSELIIKRKP